MLYVDTIPNDIPTDRSIQARKAFTQEMVRDLYANRTPSNVKGIACYNGPYSISSGAKYEGPITIKYKWDVYNTE